MGREILLDADGVVIRPRHKYFSEKFSEEYSIPLEEVLPFFKGEFKKAVRGEADIKDVLPPYLIKWGWTGTTEDFLRYWYEGERDLDENVLEVVRDLRKKGDKVYLASDNEAGRARYLMNVVGLGNEFDGGFFSSDLGVTKSDPRFFLTVAERLKVSPSDIHYWDDDPKNVEVANSVDVVGNVYTSHKDIK